MTLDLALFDLAGLDSTQSSAKLDCGGQRIDCAVVGCTVVHPELERF